LIAALARGDEVAQLMASTAREGDYVIQGGILDAEGSPAIDTTASTIPEGRAFDLTLVLLVQHAASVAG